MPEEVKTPETPPAGGPPPAINADEIRKMIADGVQQYMATDDKDGAGLGIHQDRPADGSVPKPTENPLQAVIDPIVGPSLRRSEMLSASALDASLFYATNQEALKHRGEIEKMHNASIQQGTPFTRDTLWAYLRGKPENFDKFVKEKMEAEAKQVEEAKLAEAGGGGIRPAGGKVKDAFSASDEELSNALKDQPF